MKPPPVLSRGFIGDELGSEGPPFAVIVPVPVERTTSYMQGTKKAPGAILSASAQLETYHPLLDVDLAGSGVATLASPLGTKEELYAFAGTQKEWLAGTFPCFVGGEHSITPWILEGLGLREIGIVWLDAHADLRGSYRGDRESHACAARNSLPFGGIVEIGVRSYSPEERDYIRSCGGVRVFPRWGREAMEAVDSLPGTVYLSIDYDALDVSVLRAVGTPEPGGLGWEELTGILDHVFGAKRVVAMDAVELCPSPSDEASSFVAARVVFECLCRARIQGNRRA